jgi:cobalt-zinc-cadmium efflux system outer membrane protein
MRLAIRIGAGAFVLACTAVSLSAQSGAPAAATFTLTEEEVVGRAHQHDVRLAAARTRTLEVRAAQAERARWPDPTVSFVREAVADEADTFVLGRQDLPLTGRLGLLRAAGDAAGARAAADQRLARADVTADVRLAFDRLVLAQEREVVWRNAVATLDQLVGVLRTREDAGEGSAYDRMRGARALADLRDGLAGASVERIRAQGALAGYLGPDVAADRLVAVPPNAAVDEAPATVEALIDRALSQRADLQVLQYDIERFTLERRAAERLRVPTPSVGAGLKQSDTGSSRHSGYQFSLDVTLPLFNRGQFAAAQARAQGDRAAAEAAALRRHVALDVRTAHTSLQRGLERLDAYGRAVEDTSDPLVATVRVAYEEGELGILELLDASQQALEARLRLLDLAAAARRARIELDRVTGRER